MMKHKFVSTLLIFFFLVTSSFQIPPQQQSLEFAPVKIVFKNCVKGANIVLYDSSYVNPFGEEFTINKFRYYVSNLALKGHGKNFLRSNDFYLIDEKNPESQEIELEVPTGKYLSINFLLGVDSLHNVSGAQSGALDPINDMFWTWNTGYVMAKLEGNSPSSTIVNHKYEFHIGGFSGKYNVLKNIELKFPGKPFILKNKMSVEIVVEADINTWWQNPTDIKIADRPAINSPGIHALEISNNYAKMFTIKSVTCQP
ncbi:MAG: MbnP family protein [Ginsengibacter sp.]